MDQNERFYTVDEFCRRAHVSRVTFYKWRKNGEAPRLLRMGNRLRITPKDFEAWEAKRAEVAAQEIAA